MWLATARCVFCRVRRALRSIVLCCAFSPISSHIRSGAAVVVLLMLVSTLIALMPPYFTKILIDDVLKLNEGLAAAQGAAKTAVGQFFRSFETAALALTVAVGLSCSSAYPHPYP